jgi:hypothetical protein
MAGTLALNVEILGEFKNLTAATRGAGDQLSKLNQTTSGISSGMIKALGAIGIGFSLSAITQQFENLTKAAIEDSKSQEILSIAMLNTGKATKSQVAEAEELIGKMQITAAVADDELRPAFQKFFIATGDVTKSQKLLEIALDASAGTGKDLDAVSQAMAKSLAGSDTALVRLIPSIAGATDPMQVLADTFKGAAEAAADTDPYQRISVIMGEIQETIGYALLPILEDFAEWFIEALPHIENFIGLLVESFGDPKVKDGMANMEESFGRLIESIGILFGSTETDQAKGFVNFWTVLSAALSEVADLLNFIVASVAFITGNPKALNDILSPYVQGGAQLLGTTFAPTVVDQPGRSNQPRSSGPVINNNITVQTNATATAIADAINRANRATGTNLIRAR